MMNFYGFFIFKRQAIFYRLPCYFKTTCNASACQFQLTQPDHFSRNNCTGKLFDGVFIKCFKVSDLSETFLKMEGMHKKKMKSSVEQIVTTVKLDIPDKDPLESFRGELDTLLIHEDFYNSFEDLCDLDVVQ